MAFKRRENLPQIKRHNKPVTYLGMRQRGLPQITRSNGRRPGFFSNLFRRRSPRVPQITGYQQRSQRTFTYVWGAVGGAIIMERGVRYVKGLRAYYACRDPRPASRSGQPAPVKQHQPVSLSKPQQASLGWSFSF